MFWQMVKEHIVQMIWHDKGLAGSRWIKMRDVSDSVEEWLVR